MFEQITVQRAIQSNTEWSTIINKTLSGRQGRARSVQQSVDDLARLVRALGAQAQLCAPGVPEQGLRVGDDVFKSPASDVDPVPFNLMLQAELVTGSTNDGLELRVYTGIGVRQLRRYNITPNSEVLRISGRGVAIEVQARLVSSGQTIRVLGGLAWDPDAGAEVTSGLATHIQSKTTLNNAQQTTDSSNTAVASLGALQPQTRQIIASCDPLTGGSDQRPVVIALFGQRIRDDFWVRLGALVTGPLLPAGSNSIVIDIAPGIYDTMGYMTCEFMNTNGGTTELLIHEVMEMET